MTGAARGLGRGAALGVVATGLDRVAALAIALWLPRHLGLEDHSRYTLVLTLLAFFQTLPDASLESVLVARIAREGERDADLAGAAATVRAAASLVFGLAGLAAIGLASGDAGLALAATPWALGLWLAAANPYRALFRAAAPVLRVLAAASLLAASGQVLTALLVSESRERHLLTATIVSGIVTIALGALLVPPLGARGAASASVVGMLGGQLTLVVLPDTRAAALGMLRAMGRPLALAAGTAWLAVALGWGVPLGSLLLVGVYGMAVVVTRNATWADVIRWTG